MRDDEPRGVSSAPSMARGVKFTGPSGPLRVVDRIFLKPMIIASFVDLFPGTGSDAGAKLTALPNHAGAEPDGAAEQAASKNSCRRTTFASQGRAQRTQNRPNHGGSSRLPCGFGEIGIERFVLEKFAFSLARTLDCRIH